LNQDSVISILRAHEIELKNLGIVRLALFGSVARGETGKDVDLMAEFDDSRRLTPLDMVKFERHLSEMMALGSILRTANR
jgi:predicted nucleotidyltransferase